MCLKLKYIRQRLNLNHFRGNRYVLLIMPVIFIGLAHCTTGNSESDDVNWISSPASPKLIPVGGNHLMPVLPPQQISLQVTENNKMNTVSFVRQESDYSPVVLLDSATIVVDISEQQLYLYEGDKIVANNRVKSYPVSTSKYGIGNQAGSNKTPLGRHRLEKKIGEGAPTGMIFKARQSTGKIAIINGEENYDFVTTRIMWLKGLEPGKNLGRGIDSYRRYIYIHGTAEEDKIGQPASHGCIRMYNYDVIDLFDRVKEGTEVYIRR